MPQWLSTGLGSIDSADCALIPQCVAHETVVPLFGLIGSVLERTKEFKKFGGPIQLASNAMEGFRSIDEDLAQRPGRLTLRALGGGGACLRKLPGSPRWGTCGIPRWWWPSSELKANTIDPRCMKVACATCTQYGTSTAVHAQM